jgi:DNA-binding HxlR family transcriptional regulator
VGAKTDAERVTLGGEANAAHAALAQYIESLEQTRPLMGGDLGRKILAHIDHGPARLVDLAVVVEASKSQVQRELGKLEALGRVVRLTPGVWGLEGHTLAAMPAQTVARKARRGEIPDAVEAYLRGLGAGVGARPCDILAHLRGRWPRLVGQGINNFLRELEAQGRVERVAPGIWCARTAVNGYAPPSITP